MNMVVDISPMGVGGMTGWYFGGLPCFLTTFTSNADVLQCIGVKFETLSKLIKQITTTT